ncbi:WG repeat-containing protein [Flavobacterium sp. MFBS3-15]|uniref:WG repeat-containing protein n=1 Tax=Flavobacterium sp. MFBS3-15 TaxID=2989816 RepID=UPI0022367E9F|nr:WG repeat-containing protein [Flavobacterium sp. MFBS3-15]MCW4468255.1 WG repeat-containing protein [Flavobacterium sp. MFBS3-15]
MKKIILPILFAFTAAASGQVIETVIVQEPLTEGWVKVYRDGNIGYIDDMGQEVIPPVYDEIGRFGDYCGSMAIVKKENLFGLIDVDGNPVTDVIYDEIGKPGEYNSDWILVKFDGLYGFIDCSGIVVVEPAYTQVEIKRGKLKTN